MLLLATVALCLGGCGIPDYESINTPTVINDTFTATGTVVGFTTPADDSNITGYIIYYKIYSQSDYSTESSLDESAFDEYSYINSNEEMPTGSAIPNQQGFFRIGEVGNKTVDQEFTIDHPGAGVNIYIDFDPGGAGSLDSNSWFQPVVAFGASSYSPLTGGTQLAVLARGFLDPTDNEGYVWTEPKTYADAVIPGDTLRLFVNDWDFDDGNGDGFYDGDLRRSNAGAPYNDQQHQPGTTLADIQAVSADDIFDGGQTTQITIALAVHSFGRDISNATFTLLESTPILIGEIRYPGLNDTTIRTPSGRQP